MASSSASLRSRSRIAAARASSPKVSAQEPTVLLEVMIVDARV
jgi:hypothetical protein